MRSTHGKIRTPYRTYVIGKNNVIVTYTVALCYRHFLAPSPALMVHFQLTYIGLKLNYLIVMYRLLVIADLLIL